jgi:predicted DNA-binding transcriptional regulator YafY
LENSLPQLPDPDDWQSVSRRPGRARRAHVHITDEGLRIAAVLRRLQPIRVRRGRTPIDARWLEASFRLDTIDGAVLDVLSLGPHIRVIEPPELRDRVADNAQRIVLLYVDSRPSSTERGMCSGVIGTR